MKIFNAFKYAFSGIRYCFLCERNFVIQLIAAGVVCVAGFVFKITTTEWFAVLFLFGLVLAFEMINTALEILCNVKSEAFHPGIKKVKDIAAGAVLLVSILSVIVGAIIFLPKIQLLIK